MDEFQEIRRMWTWRLFVWGIRIAWAALLLLVPALLLSDMGALMILPAFAGMFMSIPFRVVAFWRVDIPFVVLLGQAAREAMPEMVRERLSIRPLAGPPAFQRLVKRASTPRPVDGQQAATAEEMLEAIRPSWQYRMCAWGYRLIVAGLLLLCGGVLVAGSAGWTAIWPVAVFIGFAMTIPLAWVAIDSLRLPPGQIMVRVLRDALDPTFH